ncbi:hypothetical protein L596_025784 [Steinernema carpocapsae]|uniref:Uncharacterized protein n=1 Tax=Steinernema carpocapsae TaxID=34508 RepID=A0A4U5M9X0_STECR|nr:hypothetical protein L596_025784 [Steinernema carpocapsae]
MDTNLVLFVQCLKLENLTKNAHFRIKTLTAPQKCPQKRGTIPTSIIAVAVWRPIGSFYVCLFKNSLLPRQTFVSILVNISLKGLSVHEGPVSD